MPPSHKNLSVFQLQRSISFQVNRSCVHYRFDKSHNRVQLSFNAEGNILTFAHSACKSNFTPLSQFRLRVIGSVASYAILDFAVISQSSGSDAGTIIIISAGEVITESGKQREFMPLFPHVQGEAGLL